MQDVRDISLLIQAQVPLITFATHDEKRALELLVRVAIGQQLRAFCWSVTRGLQRLDLTGEPTAPREEPESPTEVLEAIKRQRQPALFALCDYHPFFPGHPAHVRHLKEIALDHAELGHTVVLLGHDPELPMELTRYSARFAMSLPTDAQLAAIIRAEVARWQEENPDLKLQTESGVLKRLVANLRGLSQRDARRLIRGAIRDDGAFTESDLPEVNRAKFALLGMDGVLSFEYDTARFSDVGGLSRLKEWVELRRSIFMRPAEGDAPKGVLLLGVQGGGKSLAAKAIAGLWGVPLLRLDMAVLYNKYIGETEKNLRTALEQAELMQPCVLWIDEIEKGVAGDSSDEGTSRRILGTLLTWLAERRERVFVVATANDVSSLPPELMRKGRFDEIFFVDLPDAIVREQILAIHLRKRNFDPNQFDLGALARAGAGFSGAELEQAVVAALYAASARREPLDTDHVLAEIAGTSPLSVVMAERMQALREWAAGRTVAAH